LTAAQRKQIVKLAAQGAMNNGLQYRVVTTGRVAILIQKHCGVRSIGVMLRASCTSWAQLPEAGTPRSVSAIEEKIEEWETETLPR